MELTDRNLIFIVGVGRSGTTLVQCMLNAHPDMCFPPETHFLRSYVASKKSIKIFRRKGLEGVEAKLNEDSYIKRLHLNMHELFTPFRNGEQFSFAKLYMILLKSFAEKRYKSHLGDKDPRSIEYLPFIYQCFPEARVIHVIRDPRDVIVSRMKADWSKQRSFYNHVFVYRMQMRLGLQEGYNLFKDRYQEVIYEKLLQNPEQTLKEICTRLRLKYDPQMLNFGASAKELISPGEIQWKKESMGPLLTNNIEKWKDTFSSWQVAVIERACSQAFDSLGYTKNNAESQLPWWQRFFLKFLEINFVILEQFYRTWRSLRSQSVDATKHLPHRGI